MQDLSSEHKKTPPKNYQNDLKLSADSFRIKKRQFFPYRVSKIHVNLQHRK